MDDKLNLKLKHSDTHELKEFDGPKRDIGNGHPVIAGHQFASQHDNRSLRSDNSRSNFSHSNFDKSSFNMRFHRHLEPDERSEAEKSYASTRDVHLTEEDTYSHVSSLERLQYENYSSYLEKKFLKAIHDNLHFEVEEMLWKQKHEVHVNTMDDIGHSALAIACLSGSVQMMEVLLKYGSQIREELLICVDQDFREGAVIILNRLWAIQGAAAVNQPPVDRPQLFPRGATAVKVAGVTNNLEMLKLLLYYGAEPIPMPTEESSMQNMDDVFYTMRALASPAYCLVMAREDPMMMAFKVSSHCKSLANAAPHYKEQFHKLSEKMEDFATQWFGNASDNYEVDMIIGMRDQSRVSDQAPVQKANKYSRIRYALHNDHYKFVAHPYCQQVIMKDFEANLPGGWRDKPTAMKLVLITVITSFTPFWILFNWLCPNKATITTKFANTLDWPYMKLLSNMILFAIIQVALLVDKNRFEIIHFKLDDATEMRRSLLQSSEHLENYYLSSVTPLKVYILIWTLGNVWGELQKISMWGYDSYKREGANMMSLAMTAFFTASSIANIIIWCTKYDTMPAPQKATDVPKWAVELAYFQEVMVSIGTLILFQRLAYWISLSSFMGMTFYLLTVPLKAIFQFFILFIFFFIAFVVSLNGLLWPSYSALLNYCNTGNYGPGASARNTSAVTLVGFGLECRKLTDGSEQAEREYAFLREMISLVGVTFELIYAMFGADPSSRLLTKFGNYSTPQETAGALLFAVYTFFQILVRLNVLIALIVAALTQAFKDANDKFKFQRTKIMITFIDPDDPTWIPSPLNLIPRLRSIQALIETRAKNRMDTTSGSSREQIVKEAEEKAKKERRAKSNMIGNVSKRVLRLTAKQKVERKITVDHLKDLQSSLSPIIEQSKRRLADLDSVLKNLLERKFKMSKKELSLKSRKTSFVKKDEIDPQEAK